MFLALGVSPLEKEWKERKRPVDKSVKHGKITVGKMFPASSGGGFHIRSQRECNLLLTAALPSSVLVLVE